MEGILQYNDDSSEDSEVQTGKAKSTEHGQELSEGLDTSPARKKQSKHGARVCMPRSLAGPAYSATADCRDC